MRTYSEWVQYFLNNGAGLKLAEIMAKNKILDKNEDKNCRNNCIRRVNDAGDSD